MTKEDLNNIKWKMVSHMSLRNGHEAMYKSDTPFFTIYKSVFVRFRNGEPTNKESVEYGYNGKWYKDAERLLDAINQNT